MPESVTAYAKGVMGEVAACDYLCTRGMQLVERRWRCATGEIDLILLDGGTLVFAEVKARPRSDRYQAQYAVTANKQRRMLEAARYYLATHPEYAMRVIRFDVVTVTRDGIWHIPNAFEGREW